MFHLKVKITKNQTTGIIETNPFGAGAQAGALYGVGEWAWAAPCTGTVPCEQND